MDVNKAVKLVLSKFPGRIPTGYWVHNDIYIINTKPIKMIRGVTAPSQFAVTKDGEVYGVNPMTYKLSISNMKKL